MKKQGKTEVITIRVTKHQKEKLKKKACSNMMSLTDYLTAQGLDSSKQCQIISPETLCIPVYAQQICKYVKEHYGEDDNLKDWSEKIWNAL